MQSRPVRRGLVGALVGAVWLAALYAVAPLVGGFAPVVIAEAVIVRSPGWLSTLAIGFLGFSAKPVLLGSVLLGLVAVAAAVWIAWPRYRPDATRLGIVAGVIVTVAAVGLAGGVSLGAAVGVVVAVAAPYVVSRLLAEPTPSSNRRQFLRRFGTVGVAGVGALVGLRAAVEWFSGSDGSASPGDGTGGSSASVTDTGGTPQPSAGDSRFDFAGMPAAVTPPDEHYVIDINIQPPRVDPETWTLDIEGAVETPYSLSYEDLRDHDGNVEQITTMLCISNTVGGNLISTGRWTGVQLSDLIAEAAPTGAAMDVVTHAADGYSEAIPLDIVEREDILIAHQLGDSRLPRRHGRPARLLIPGRYGMKMTKWITRIELVEAEHDAYWEERGWDEAAVVNTMSYVRGAARDGDRVTVGGVAFSGLETGVQEIEAVEVSVDGGSTWQAAELEEPIAAHAWRRWRYEFNAPDRSEFEVVVRAITRDGEVQTEERTSPRPGGATGWHRRTVQI